VARNALTHGVTVSDASAVVERLGENPSEYQELADQIFQEVEPTGVIDGYFAKLVLDSFWRRRRLERYEHHLLNSRLEGLRKEVVERYYRKHTDSPPPELEFVQFSDTVTEQDVFRQAKQVVRMASENYDICRDDNFRFYVARARGDYARDLGAKVACEILGKEIAANPDRFAGIPDLDVLSPKQVAAVTRYARALEEKKLREMLEVFRLQQEFKCGEHEAMLPGNKELKKIQRYGRYLDRTVIRSLAAIRSWQRRSES
jgi:hypothetical protein